MTNSGVIEQYERRQREVSLSHPLSLKSRQYIIILIIYIYQIERLREKVGNQEAQKAKTERKIQRTKNKWLPALQELATNIGEKFSLAFERESYFFSFLCDPRDCHFSLLTSISFILLFLTYRCSLCG